MEFYFFVVYLVTLLSFAVSQVAGRTTFTINSRANVPSLTVPHLLSPQQEKNIRNHLLMQFRESLGRSRSARSCEHIKEVDPARETGYYLVSTNKGAFSSRMVYCNMGSICGDADGSWTRAVWIDVANKSNNCPDGFRTVNSGRRVCQKSAGRKCSSTSFPTQGVEYTQVCGRVTGYARSSPDGFRGIGIRYPEGVTIAQGTDRPTDRHLWTYLTDHKRCGKCGRNDTRHRRVGTNYYCDSATNGDFVSNHDYWGAHLWATSQCVSRTSSRCCGQNLQGWFHRQNLTLSSDPLRVYACADSQFSDEEVYFDLVEIYVK